MRRKGLGVVLSAHADVVLEKQKEWTAGVSREKSMKVHHSELQLKVPIFLWLVSRA